MELLYWYSQKHIAIRLSRANRGLPVYRCTPIEYSMSVKLLTVHHLEFLSLKGGCKGSSESTLVKITTTPGLHGKRFIKCTTMSPDQQPVNLLNVCVIC